MGKVFRKAFRILGLDEREGRWVVGVLRNHKLDIPMTTTYRIINHLMFINLILTFVAIEAIILFNLKQSNTIRRYATYL